MVPTFQPRKPRRHRARAASAMAAAPAITVVSVTAHDQYLADWEFSAPVTLVGGAGSNVPELEIDGGGQGSTGPDSVTQISPTVLRADYSTTTGVFPGDAWQIATQPGTIVQELEIPQSGNVSG